MDYTTIQTDLADGVLTITLNRPERMNAFTVAMAAELEHAFGAVNTQDEVRAVIVTGSGKAFCAGMDLDVDGNVFGLDEHQRPTLTDMRERLDDPAIRSGVRDTGGRVTLAIYDCAKPVIAAINGAAVGIGATMLLPMDFRFASTESRIGFVFGRIGIVPEACSTWFLPRIVGLPKALEWFYSARIMDAAEAHAGGLLNEIVPPGQLLQRARAFALSLLADLSPVSVALIRQMTWRNSALPSPNAAHEIDSLAVFYTSLGDGKEGVQAFLDKRAPEYRATVSSDMPPFYPWWQPDKR
ncbi:crotonase/enoyl-CoA hydratase family protein [Sphingobium sp. Sx8-8]|uniref:crotonase/enoyl-CoA hydratase family protein n=1 Tax=Sphingobium sp. Sx8-8 TaxID=2933617 RepID=UPI001F5797E6|nr:crotonase/enoyl-CoA hydratase family protein [Sphingobium sp. Sx8-8]